MSGHGQALRMKYQLAQLARRHRVAAPDVDPAPLPLLPAVDHDVFVEGFATTPDVDLQRTRFRGWCFSFLPWERKPPLLLRHAGEPVGEVLDMRYSERGALWVRAHVRDRTAARMPAFSVAGAVENFELRDVDDPGE
jgi:hypothetical protein